MISFKQSFKAITFAAVMLSILSVAGVASAAGIASMQPGFEENRGQFGQLGDFLLEGNGYNFRVAKSPVIELYKSRHHSVSSVDQKRSGEPAHSDTEAVKMIDLVRLQLDFVGANDKPKAQGLESFGGVTNYLIGANKQNWHTGIKRYESVRYDQLYAGIDVIYRITDQLPEYVFQISPGTDPDQIAMQYKGAEAIELKNSGALEITASDYQFSQHAPKAWQTIEGEITPVEVAYRQDENGISFSLGRYDPGHELIIDPVLEFSSYFGGAASETAEGLHTDADGNIYLIGTASSPGLATADAFVQQNPLVVSERIFTPSCSDCSDPVVPGSENRVTRVTTVTSSEALLVAKFSPDGRQRLWTTYFALGPQTGGSRINANSTGVSPDGEVAFGLKAAQGMPLRNHTQAFDPDQINAYVAKLNEDGTDLVFATYLQFASSDGPAPSLSIQRGLDVGPSGEVAVTGGAGAANNLPVLKPLDGQSCTLNADELEYTEPFVTLFDANGLLIFSSCFGGDSREGSLVEWARDVSIGADGRLYVLGYTSMTDFPLVNPYKVNMVIRGRVICLSRSSTPAPVPPHWTSLHSLGHLHVVPRLVETALVVSAISRTRFQSIPEGLSPLPAAPMNFIFLW